MKLYPIVTGSVVRSLAGRDQGRLFVVIQEIDDDFVYVANGKLRTMDRLKKKRRKHLKPTGTIVEDIRNRVQNDGKIEDHEIRSWLKKEEEKLVQV
ncbi:MAG: RNA-binding protein [Clostridia bacterium]|nr:RNA-binding protein [Clostridia bacterium]